MNRFEHIQGRPQMNNGNPQSADRPNKRQTERETPLKTLPSLKLRIRTVEMFVHVETRAAHFALAITNSATELDVLDSQEFTLTKGNETTFSIALISLYF